MIGTGILRVLLVPLDAGVVAGNIIHHVGPQPPGVNQDVPLVNEREPFVSIVRVLEGVTRALLSIAARC